MIDLSFHSISHFLRLCFRSAFIFHKSLSCPANHPWFSSAVHSHVPAVDWHFQFHWLCSAAFAHIFCSQTPLLNSQLAVSPSCHYICFLHLLPSALTTLIIDLISLLFTNPVSSSIDFLCYPDFKLLIVTVITAFFISSNWLICCRWRKVIFLTSTFLVQLFRWLLHTFLPRFPYFCHVRKNLVLTTFLPTTNNAILLTTRVPVLDMFRFPSSSEIFIVLPLSVCWNYKLSHHQFCHPYLLPANSSILETPQIHLVYRLCHHQCLHQLQSLAVQIRQLMLTTVHTAILCILQNNTIDISLKTGHTQLLFSLQSHHHSSSCCHDFYEMLFYKWIFNLQIHHNWRLAFTLPQLANTIRVATISTTANDHSFFNQFAQWVTNWAFTFHVQSPNLQLPFPTSCSILPTAIELPQLANTIHAATISTTTIDYWFFNLHTQPALKTANTTR